jgi:hypothetical protein
VEIILVQQYIVVLQRKMVATIWKFQQVAGSMPQYPEQQVILVLVAVVE